MLISRYIPAVLLLVLLAARARSASWQLIQPFDPTTQDHVLVTTNGVHNEEGESQSAEVFGGRIYYIVHTDGTARPTKVYAFDPETGQHAQLLDEATDQFWSVRTMRGALYISHQNGKLWRYDGAQVQLLSGTPFVPTNHVTAMAEFGGAMYFATRDGRIYSSTDGATFTLRTTIRTTKPIFALFAWNGYLYGADSEDYSFSCKIFRSADGISWATVGTFSAYGMYGFAAESGALYVAGVDDPGGASFAIRATSNGTTWNTIFYTTSEGKSLNGHPEFFSQTRTAYFCTEWIYPSHVPRIVPVQNSMAGSRILPQHGFTSLIEVNGRLFGIGAQRSTAWDTSPHVISLLGNYSRSTNAPPIANPRAVGTYADQSATITLTGSDPGGAPLTFSVVANPSHGTLMPTNGAARIYTPNADYVGPDSFMFTVSNGQDVSAPAIVTITVKPRPVLVIPGIFASSLCVPPSSSCLLGNGWPADVFFGIGGDPQNLQFTEAGAPRTDTVSAQLQPTGLLGGISNLVEFLSTNGYQRDETLFSFPYDFRYSVPSIAAQLAQRIDQIRTSSGAADIDLIAHSMGGLIAKQYLQDHRNVPHVRTLVMLGTPHLGTPYALKVLRYGDAFSFLRSFFVHECKVKRAGHNWPSGFNLLPGQQYFTTSGPYFSIQEDEATPPLFDFSATTNAIATVPEEVCPLLATDPAPIATVSPIRLAEDTTSFHQQLDGWRKPTGVNAYMIAGYGKRTINQIQEVRFNTFRKMPLFPKTLRGDGTVVLDSAASVMADGIYYADLAALNADHEGMVESPDLQQQTLQLLRHNLAPVGLNISLVPPRNPDTNAITFVVLSPVQLSVVNSQGQRTGFLDDGSKEESIPFSAADRIDHFQYVTVPAGQGCQPWPGVCDYFGVVLRGTGDGIFSLLQIDVDATGQPVRTLAWMNIPVQVGTVARLGTYFGDEVPLLYTPLGALNPSSRANGPIRFHDLALEATARQELAFVGQDVPFTLTVTNAGVTRANAVELTIALPPAVALVSKSSDSCIVTDYGMDCSLGNLDRGAVASITVTVRLLQTGYPTLQAWVGANGIDTEPANNEATVGVAAFNAPCDAIAVLVSWISREIPQRSARPFIATLKAACASFDQGHTIAGIQQLEAFENKVPAQLGRENPALATELIGVAEKIVQALR